MVFDAVVPLFQALVRILMWRILRSDLERELFVLLKENQILKRRQRRPRITDWDRSFYLALHDAPRGLLRRLILIKPETILRWQRRRAEKKWDHGKQGRVGRPAVTLEIQRLVVEMKRANPRWGAQRIMGELGKLGLKTCKASVLKILKEAGLGPSVRRRLGQSWRGFVSGHGKRIFACDFFSVETIFLKTLEVFFIIDIATREIISYSVTAKRDTEWLRNHLRSVFSFAEKAPDILISDNDLVYGKWLKPYLKDYYEIELRQIPPYRPVFNCFAERMVRTFREELTDRVLIFNENDLHSVLREYVAYYNSRRAHSSLGFTSPRSSAGKRTLDRGSSICRRKILGGLISDFELVA